MTFIGWNPDLNILTLISSWLELEAVFSPKISRKGEEYSRRTNTQFHVYTFMTERYLKMSYKDKNI